MIFLRIRFKKSIRKSPKLVVGFGDDFLSVSFTAIANSCVFVEDFCKEVNELEEECFYTACMTIAAAGLFFGLLGFNDDDFFVTGVSFAVTIVVNMTGLGKTFRDNVLA